MPTSSSDESQRERVERGIEYAHPDVDVSVAAYGHDWVKLVLRGPAPALREAVWDLRQRYDPDATAKVTEGSMVVLLHR